MVRFAINKDYDNEREVEAVGFGTAGDFIDFHGFNDHGDTVVTFRMRAAQVETIERIGA